MGGKKQTSLNIVDVVIKEVLYCEVTGLAKKTRYVPVGIQAVDL